MDEKPPPKWTPNGGMIPRLVYNHRMQKRGNQLDLQQQQMAYMGQGQPGYPGGQPGYPMQQPMVPGAQQMAPPMWGGVPQQQQPSIQPQYGGMPTMPQQPAIQPQYAAQPMMQVPMGYVPGAVCDHGGGLDYTEEFTAQGIIWTFVCFPCGLYCLFNNRDKLCRRCYRKIN